MRGPAADLCNRLAFATRSATSSGHSEASNMNEHISVGIGMPRRDFLKTTALAVAGLSGGLTGAPAAEPNRKRRNIKLGLDNFSLRGMGWKAPALIDYAASLNTDSLFITDLDAFENFQDKYLTELKARATDKGLQIHLGTWSICPSSKAFKDKWGTAEEHLALGIRMARLLGSPVLRVILGTGEDRKTPGGIEACIADTVRVLRSERIKAVEGRVKVAVENHAGDMQAAELVQLIERAGKEFVGANMDSGNAVWTMEDPLASLEILGPYVVTTSLRDSAIWESENGATVQWTAMGEGMIDWNKYFDRFEQLCPGVPVHIETISGFNREIPYLKPEFWNAWPKAKAVDFARFVALAKKGSPRQPYKAPEGKDRKLAEQEYQKGEIERSLRYCKETLGLGLKS
jgi:sugar phosphate isomerase/epimerase